MSDWTRGKDGRSNTSAEFIRLVDEVDRLILNSGHFLIRGQTRGVARLIVAQLAHEQGMRLGSPCCPAHLVAVGEGHLDKCCNGCPGVVS